MDMMAWYIVGTLFLIPVGFLLNFALNIWQDTRPDKMRAVYVDSNKQISSRRVTLDPGGKTFRLSIGKKMKYKIEPAAVVRSGMFRIPTSYYILGQKEPLNLLEMKAETPISAEDFEEATEAHVAREIIAAFSDDFITPATTMIILVVIMCAVMGFIWYDLSGDLNTIIEGLGLDMPDEVINNVTQQ